jgi:hypothetical protein
LERLHSPAPDVRFYRLPNMEIEMRAQADTNITRDGTTGRPRNDEILIITRYKLRR